MAEKETEMITYIAIEDAVIGANWYGKGSKIERPKTEKFEHKCFVKEAEYTPLSSRGYYDPDKEDLDAIARLRGMSL